MDFIGVVETVWAIKYGMSHYKAIHGRRLSGDNSSYTKDFLQISGECERAMSRALGTELDIGQGIIVSLDWPGGREPNAKVQRTTDRYSLRWPTTGTAPEPWRMQLRLGPGSLHSIEGDPTIATVEDADQQWIDFQAKGHQPWLVVVKLRGEERRFHVRAFLGNPPSHLRHASIEFLPSPIRELIVSSGRNNQACRVREFNAGADAHSSERVLFDPSSNHRCFSEFDEAKATDLVDADVPDNKTVSEVIDELKKRLQFPPQLLEPVAQYSVTTRRALARDRSFRQSVLSQYDYACAICAESIQTPNGDSACQAAHVFPRSSNGADDLRNGISLCLRHHWALDVGWIALSDDRRLIVNQDLPSSSDYDFISDFEMMEIAAPYNLEAAVSPIYSREHRALFGFR